LSNREKEKMGRVDEICFEAPEISMSSDISIDAVISLVTVSKLTKMEVEANCYCPGKGSGSAGNSNSNNNRGISVTPPPFVAQPAPVVKAVAPAPKPAVAAPVAKPIATPVAKAVATPVVAPVVAPVSAPVVDSKPTEPVPVPDAAGALNTADETAAESTLNNSNSILEYNSNLSVGGTFVSKWKQQNVPGEYELLKEDTMGRPIYKRKEPTSDGGAVYLYHIHHSKKWRVGPNHDGPAAYNCWLYITSKVDQPMMIAKDQLRTKRNWKEFDTSNNKWLEVKNMNITQL